MKLGQKEIGIKIEEKVKKPKASSKLTIFKQKSGCFSFYKLPDRKNF